MIQLQVYIIVDFQSGINLILLDGSDYSERIRTLTFSESNTVRRVSIPITDDSDIEDLEMFFANLEIDSIAFPAVSVNPDQASISIISDDCK